MLVSKKKLAGLPKMTIAENSPLHLVNSCLRSLADVKTSIVAANDKLDLAMAKSKVLGVMETCMSILRALDKTTPVENGTVIARRSRPTLPAEVLHRIFRLLSAMPYEDRREQMAIVDLLAR